MQLVGGAIAVVLIGVVVTASGAEEQAGQWEQHNAAHKYGPKIEPRQSGFHQHARFFKQFDAAPGFVGGLSGTQEHSLILSHLFVCRRIAC